MTYTKPDVRPSNPRFSSGPCTKHPNWTFKSIEQASLGRSHRSGECKDKLANLIELTGEVLGIPKDYRIGIVPASDTGAFEMAMWSLLGARPVSVAAWESFGLGWVSDITKQLKLDATVYEADYGKGVDMSLVDYNHDVCFTWNGTTSGVRVQSGDVIPADRQGLTICDATSAAFAQDLPWDKLDVTTFSWQKIMGGEGAHGMLILSPRAVERLESYTPAWPLPKIFRLTKSGKLIEGIFKGETINTPSMMAVEDFLSALDWAKSIGGLSALIARADRNAQAVDDFCARHSWIENIVHQAELRSNTSVCLAFTDPEITDASGLSKAIVTRLAQEGAAFDIGAHRDAPAGLRIWCGATVETQDITDMLAWLDWAYHSERNNF